MLHNMFFFMLHNISYAKINMLHKIFFSVKFNIIYLNAFRYAWRLLFWRVVSLCWSWRWVQASVTVYSAQMKGRASRWNQTDCMRIMLRRASSASSGKSSASRRSSSVGFDEFGFALSKKRDKKLQHRCHDYR